MTGVSIRIDGTTEALRDLSAIAARLDDQRPMWDEIGASLELSTSERFQQGRGPDGVMWPRSWRARETGGQTLVDSGRLRQSITHNVIGNGVEVGSNVDYAASHQFGVTIRAKTSKGLRFKFSKSGANRPSWATKMQVTLPPRPFLGVDAEDEQSILAIASDYVGGPDAD